jgi:hypothetical protein
LEHLNVFGAHTPLAQKELEDPMRGGAEARDRDLLSFEIRRSLDVGARHQSLQARLERRCG